jgi:uncharacterized protein
MERNERIQAIYEAILNSDVPLSGGALAKRFSVSRQVIVQDIALLKAKNIDIVATNRGYVCHTSRVQRVYACYHDMDLMEAEMNAIVDCGGCIENVFVEHDVYGKLQAEMHIASRKQVKQFLEDLHAKKSKPLTDLTSGYHSHTVSAESKEDLDSIEEVLKELHILQGA